MLSKSRLTSATEHTDRRRPNLFLSVASFHNISIMISKFKDLLPSFARLNHFSTATNDHSTLSNRSLCSNLNTK